MDKFTRSYEDSVEEAPSDGSNYVRKDGAWDVLSVSSDKFLSNFTVKGDTVLTGMLTGLYSNGLIKAIKDHSGEAQFSANTSTYESVTMLTDKSALIVYRDEGDSNKGKAIVASIAGTKITYGTPLTFKNSAVLYPSVTAISATEAVVCFQDVAGSAVGTSLVLSVSGTTITAGAETIFNNATSTYIVAKFQTTNKVLVVYRDEGNSNQGTACLLTIAGTVISASAEVVFETGATTNLSLTVLSATQSVAAYTDVGNSSYGTACILNVPAGITAGTPFVFSSATTAYIDVASLNSTMLVAVYQASSLGKAVHLTAGATTLTAGTAINFSGTDCTYISASPKSATEVAIAYRNVGDSNNGYYGTISNPSSTTLTAGSQVKFNTSTAYTSMCKLLSDRIFIGFQDTGDSNRGKAYVADLSTETIKTIAGIASTDAIEGATCAVVTEGIVDFLSGLVAGTAYYSSSTGYLNSAVANYEVGIAKSTTTIMLNRVIKLVDTEKIAFIDRLIANNQTPSIDQARFYDFWKTREVKTTSGTFTVPAGVYAIGIFCLGAGANGAGNYAGAGGGLAMKIKKVVPGQQIPYTIASSIASCDGMVANPANANLGGSASGGMYNYAGSTSTLNYSYGGGGAGGNSGGATTYIYGGMSMAHWGQPTPPSYTIHNTFGGVGMWVTDEVIAASYQSPHGGGGFGSTGSTSYAASQYDTGKISGGIGRPPLQLGIFVTSDLTQNNTLSFCQNGFATSTAPQGDWNGGASCTNNSNNSAAGGLGGGGGANAGGTSYRCGSGGFGGGGGAPNVFSSNGGHGGFGGGGGRCTDAGASYSAGNGGFGGGGGSGMGSGTNGTGGAACVAIVY